MRKHRILVVEDDLKTAAYLRSYFDWQGYEVLAAGRGDEALNTARLKLPNAIILDVVLPDMSGYDVCRILRSQSRTSYVPIIFLSHRNRRNDIIGAFEAGADDYVVKPFDVEELRLRLEGVIRYSRRGILMHPVTGLPGGELIGEQLRAIKNTAEPWTLLYFNLKNFGVFRAVSDPAACNDIIMRLAEILRDAVEKYGAFNDFVGQVSDDGFVVITIPETAGVICHTVTEGFQAETVSVSHTQTTGLLGLTVNAVSSHHGPFADIREIAKMLATFPFDDVPEQGSAGTDRQSIGDIDYYHQLAEQVEVWQTDPALAQALVEAESLITTRLPDISQIGNLLHLVERAGVAADRFTRLERLQQKCRLAGENLDELPSRLRRYQRFEPASLQKNLLAVIHLWPAGQITLDNSFAALSEFWANLPALKLQQIVNNIFKWLAAYVDGQSWQVSLQINPAEAALIFTGPETLTGLDPSALSLALSQEVAGAVYGYLARKIAWRYGCRLTGEAGALTLHLPAASSPTVEAAVDRQTLRRQIRRHRLFLNQQRQQAAAPLTLEQAVRLLNPLADDLLTAVEAMLSALQTGGGINLQTYPWAAIQHNLRFVRLLALELRKNRPLIPAPVNLKTLLESMKPLVAHRLINHTLVIESESPRPVINSDQTRLLQIFINLAINALESMPTEGALKFTIKTGDYYVVEVSDEGRGITPECLPHIFDPHFSTKGSGRGIGLYNVKTYVDQLKGQVEIFSSVGQGTTVKIKLPPGWEAGYF